MANRIQKYTFTIPEAAIVSVTIDDRPVTLAPGGYEVFEEIVEMKVGGSIQDVPNVNGLLTDARGVRLGKVDIGRLNRQLAAIRIYPSLRP